MQICFNFHDADEDRFLVRINEEEYEVDPITPCISIDTSEQDVLDISIIQCPHTGTTWFSWVFWFITLPLQGLFAFLMAYGEDVWYKQINPYLITARTLIAVEQTSKVNISVDICKFNQWRRTEIDIEQENDITVNYSVHSQAIYAAYVRYIKQVISISFNGIALFSVLLYKLFDASNWVGVQICVVIMTAIVLLDLILAVTQYHKVRVLNDMLLKQSQ